MTPHALGRLGHLIGITGDAWALGLFGALGSLFRDARHLDTCCTWVLGCLRGLSNTCRPSFTWSLWGTCVDLGRLGQVIWVLAVRCLRGSTPKTLYLEHGTLVGLERLQNGCASGMALGLQGLQPSQGETRPCGVFSLFRQACPPLGRLGHPLGARPTPAYPKRQVWGGGRV